MPKRKTKRSKEQQSEAKTEIPTLEKKKSSGGESQNGEPVSVHPIIIKLSLYKQADLLKSMLEFYKKTHGIITSLPLGMKGSELLTKVSELFWSVLGSLRSKAVFWGTGWVDFFAFWGFFEVFNWILVRLLRRRLWMSWLCLRSCRTRRDYSGSLSCSICCHCLRFGRWIRFRPIFMGLTTK